MLRVALGIIAFVCVMAIPAGASQVAGLASGVDDGLGNLIFMPAVAVLVLHHIHHHGGRPRTH
jgi:hypothetical protein